MMITATKPENRHDSRNKMTFERLKYYRHLGGGALECIASRSF